MDPFGLLESKDASIPEKNQSPSPEVRKMGVPRAGERGQKGESMFPGDTASVSRVDESSGDGLHECECT